MKKYFNFRGMTALILAVILICNTIALSGCATSDPADRKTEQTKETEAQNQPPKDEVKVKKLTESAKDFYAYGEEDLITLGFCDEGEQIAYITIETAVEFLNNHIQNIRDPEYLLKYEYDGKELTLSRENGSYSVIDFEKGTIYFDDYNRFNTFSYDLGSLDVLESRGSTETEANYFLRVLASEKPGTSSLIDLKERGIPYAMQDGQGYITLQTFSDIYLTPYEVMLGYNGEGVYLFDHTLLDGIDDSYFPEEPEKLAKETVELRYKQLCLLFDFHYGLFEEHSISTMDEYITRIGLKDKLLSEDPLAYHSALKTLMFKYFSDNHSGVLMASPYNPEPEGGLDMNEASVGYWEFLEAYLLCFGERNEQFGEELEEYIEVGDTAFITFNSFSNISTDYYENPPVNGEFTDTIGLISFAHARIHRENSPVKNVVIDLATNTGGHLDAGIFLLSWVLGDAVVHIKDPIRNAEGSYIYRADVNLDGLFDENDRITDKNVYLLTSPITFSCANFVAYALKESAEVTLIGRDTGGGTACVYIATTLDGAGVNFSGSLMMSEYKNGTYYNIDRGVGVDVYISKISDIFDHQRVIEIINTLN